ncbi:DUF1294 domain-containing protein [Bacillus sp. SL00103]
MNIALIVPLILVNGYGFFLMGEDKRRAKAHKWRISEAHLWSVRAFRGRWIVCRDAVFSS